MFVITVKFVIHEKDVEKFKLRILLVFLLLHVFWKWKMYGKMKLNYQKSLNQLLVNANQTFKMGLFLCVYGAYILMEYFEDNVC